MTLVAIKKIADSKLYEFATAAHTLQRLPFMPDDHSKLVPLLPIPNRTVKRLRADDSADSRVKVGHRQALYSTPKPPRTSTFLGVFGFCLSDVTCEATNLLDTAGFWTHRDTSRPSSCEFSRNKGRLPEAGAVPAPGRPPMAGGYL